MDTFYLTTLTVATLLLILILAYIGTKMLNKSNSALVFPPSASSCPDYWLMSDDGTQCMIPEYGSKNSGNMYDITGKIELTQNDTFGLSSDNTKINFNDAGWKTTGKTNTCAQKDWANINGILWDGVNNYNSC
jgi:hypothetical protein